MCPFESGQGHHFQIFNLLLRLDQGRRLMPRRFAHATAITVPMAEQFR